MKRTLLSILSLLSIGAFSQGINPDNSGFEDWTQKDYSYPDTLASTVKQYLDQGALLEVNPLQKSSDAFEGSSSIIISSVEDANMDTINGYVILGDWGDNGPSGGHPYTFQGDSFTFHYKCDLQPNDTAWAIITLKKAGATIGGGQYPITGTQNTWTEYTAVNLGALLVPDTFFFAAISTNAIEDDSKSRPGSWIQLDEVGMKKANGDFMAIANGGFESWIDTSIFLVDDWYARGATRSTDANTGTYSIELTTSERTDGDGDQDTTQAFFTNADFYSGNSEGSPYVEQPKSLSLWVDFEPNGTDSASVSVQFKKSGSNVGGQGQYITTATSGFQEIVIPFTFSMAPDSFLVFVASGENPGSILRVDDFVLSDNPTSATEITQSKFSVYPNPAEETITLSSKGNSFIVYDVLGSEIVAQNITTTKTQISLNEFNSGVYMISVFNQTNDLIGTQRFIVK